MRIFVNSGEALVDNLRIVLDANEAGICDNNGDILEGAELHIHPTDEGVVFDILQPTDDDRWRIDKSAYQFWSDFVGLCR